MCVFIILSMRERTFNNQSEPERIFSMLNLLMCICVCNFGIQSVCERTFYNQLEDAKSFLNLHRMLKCS